MDDSQGNAILREVIKSSAHCKLLAAPLSAQLLECSPETLARILAVIREADGNNKDERHIYPLDSLMQLREQVFAKLSAGEARHLRWRFALWGLTSMDYY